jgi:MFS family permease
MSVMSRSEGLPSEFYVITISKMLSSFAVNSFAVFYLWEIISHYHSVFLSGLIVTLYLLTELSLSLLVGHLIDRFNSTRLNLLGSFIMLVGLPPLISGVHLANIYVSTVILMSGATLKLDSYSAIIKKHLQEESYKRANTLNFVVNSISSIGSTAIGGAFIILAPHLFPAALLIMIAISLLTSIQLKEQASSNKDTFNSEFSRVLSFMKKISGLLIIALFINGLFISLETYSSGLFYLILKSSPFYYTLFAAAVPAGSVPGALLANRGAFRNDSPSIIASMVLSFSPIILLIALSPIAIADVIAAFVLGIVLPIINIPIITKMMKLVPAEIYGKAMASIRIFTAGSSPAMGAIFSTLALYFSIRAVLTSVGILVIPLALYSVRVLGNFFREV